MAWLLTVAGPQAMGEATAGLNSGEIDTKFGKGGFVSTSFGLRPPEFAYAIAVDSAGGIVAGGSVRGDKWFALANGVARPEIEGNQFVQDAALQSGNRLVVAGVMIGETGFEQSRFKVG